MPRKKIGEDETLNKKKEKNSSVEFTKKKGNENAKEKKLSKKNDKQKQLPKVEAKKELPKPVEKKALPKAKTKSQLPKPKEKKSLPKVNEKKLLKDGLTPEEKERKLLEKIKEFFLNDPEKSLKLDSEIDKNTEFLSEYYDLPYRYNETVVKILAQTPKRLFIYWDVSDADNEKYRRAFGEDFFQKTYPILLVHNEELNYTYEIPINDFANSWYLDINDSKCKYTVQLGRKFKEIPNFVKEIKDKIEQENIILKNDYIEIVSSNTLEAPNDRILFEELKPTITYRNVKTGEESTKDIANVLPSFAKVYNVYDLYKVIYKEEFDSDKFDLINPSSAGTSSSITSGMFR